MIDYKSTSQYVVTFVGSSSKPYVQEPPRANDVNPEYTDLHLAGPVNFSQNIQDYTVHHQGNKLNPINISGNVLTVSV